MKVELLDKNGRGIAIGGRTPGRVMDVAPGVADVWVRRGQAKLVPEETELRMMTPDSLGQRTHRRRRQA